MKMIQATVLLMALCFVSACSGETKTAGRTVTHYQQLSQADWVTMTSAPKAAHVSNTSLIFMR